MKDEYDYSKGLTRSGSPSATRQATDPSLARQELGTHYAASLPGRSPP